MAKKEGIQLTFICKNKLCGKEFVTKRLKSKYQMQAYCSRDCAPYGYMSDEARSGKSPKGKGTE